MGMTTESKGPSVGDAPETSVRSTERGLGGTNRPESETKSISIPELGVGGAGSRKAADRSSTVVERGVSGARVVEVNPKSTTETGRGLGGTRPVDPGFKASADSSRGLGIRRRLDPTAKAASGAATDSATVAGRSAAAIPSAGSERSNGLPSTKAQRDSASRIGAEPIAGLPRIESPRVAPAQVPPSGVAPELVSRVPRPASEPVAGVPRSHSPQETSKPIEPPSTPSFESLDGAMGEVLSAEPVLPGGDPSTESLDAHAAQDEDRSSLSEPADGEALVAHPGEVVSSEVSNPRVYLYAPSGVSVQLNSTTEAPPPVQITYAPGPTHSIPFRFAVPLGIIVFAAGAMMVLLFARGNGATAETVEVRSSVDRSGQTPVARNAAEQGPGMEASTAINQAATEIVEPTGGSNMDAAAAASSGAIPELLMDLPADDPVVRRPIARRSVTEEATSKQPNPRRSARTKPRPRFDNPD